jgi:hypothetical protein
VVQRFVTYDDQFDLRERRAVVHKRFLKIVEQSDEKFTTHLINSLAIVQAQCKKVCSHCCRQMTLVGYSEAEWIVEALLVDDKWKSLFDNIIAAAILCGDGKTVNVHGYWMAQITCPLLVNNECSTYEQRPSCCRYMVSFDDPYKCSFDATLKGVGENLKISKVSDYQGPMINYSIKESVAKFGAHGGVYLVPIAIAVAHQMAARGILSVSQMAQVKQVTDPLVWSQKFFYERMKESF